MKKIIKTPRFYLLLIVLGSTLSISCLADQIPSTNDLWKVIQKQQSQIEQQNKQIKVQNQAIKELNERFSNQGKSVEKVDLKPNKLQQLASQKNSDKETTPYSFKGYAVAN